VHTSHSPAAKVVNLGYAFFILLVISAYTANLASILVQNRLHYDVHSIEDAAREQGQICTMKASEDTMIQIFPELKERTVPYDTSTATLEGLLANECKHAVMTEAGLINNKRIKNNDKRRRRRARSLLVKAGGSKGSSSGGAAAASVGASGRGTSGMGGKCNTEMVGSDIMSMSNAMPIRDEIATILSTYMVRAQDLGKYQHHLDQAEESLLNPLACPDNPGAMMTDASIHKMSTKAFLGPIITCLFATAISVVLHFYWKHKADMLRNAEKATMAAARVTLSGGSKAKLHVSIRYMRFTRGISAGILPRRAKCGRCSSECWPGGTRTVSLTPYMWWTTNT